MSETTGLTAEQILERAKALAGFGRWADAIVELQRGLAEHPDDQRLTSFLGWYEYWEGDRSRGVEAAQRALAMNARDGQSLTVLLENAIASDEPDEAREYANRQIAAYPEWSTAHLNAAWAILNQAWKANREGRTSKADRAASGAEVLHHTRQALEFEPEGEEVMRRAVSLMRDVKAHDQAVAVLDRALALYPTNEALLLLASQLKAKDDVEETKLLLGVLAENPQQRYAARKLSDNVWGRTQMIASLVPWMLAALMLVAYLAFDEGGMGSPRTERRFAEVFLLSPFVWFVIFLSFNRRALPKKYLRRVYRPVWWVWIGLVIAILASLLMFFIAFAIAARMQPHSMKMNGPYVGGITMMIGFIAVIGLAGELLVVWARIRSEARNRLFTESDAGVGSLKYELGQQASRLARLAAAAILALIPVIAAPIALRPEAAGGFAAVAIALGAPPLVLLLVRCARIVRAGGLSGRAVAQAEDRSVSDDDASDAPDGKRAGVRRAGAATLRVLAGAVTILSLAGAGLFAARHAVEHDPPPTPWELEMREQQRKMADSLGDLDEQREGLAEIAEQQERFMEELRQAH